MKSFVKLYSIINSTLCCLISVYWNYITGFFLLSGYSWFCKFLLGLSCEWAQPFGFPTVIKQRADCSSQKVERKKFSNLPTASAMKKILTMGLRILIPYMRILTMSHAFVRNSVSVNSEMCGNPSHTVIHIRP